MTTSVQPLLTFWLNWNFSPKLASWHHPRLTNLHCSAQDFSGCCCFCIWTRKTSFCKKREKLPVAESGNFLCSCVLFVVTMMKVLARVEDTDSLFLCRCRPQGNHEPWDTTIVTWTAIGNLSTQFHARMVWTQPFRMHKCWLGVRYGGNVDFYLAIHLFVARCIPSQAFSMCLTANQIWGFFTQKLWKESLLQPKEESDHELKVRPLWKAVRVIWRIWLNVPEWASIKHAIYAHQTAWDFNDTGH